MKNRDRAFRKNKTFGFLLPFKDANTDGAFSMSTTSVEKYKSNLYNVLFTGVGQRVMMPTFGTRISMLLFEGTTEDIFDSIKSEIISAANRWVPEIRITGIDFGDKLENLENNNIQMIIHFSLKNDETVQEFIEIEMSV